LVDLGKVEFVGGTWAAPNPALTSLEHTIANIAEGHKWLAKSLGLTSIPTAWEVHAYAHFAASSVLYADLGYERLVLSNINEHLKLELMRNKTLEFLWDRIPTHVLYQDMNIAEMLRTDNPKSCWTDETCDEFFAPYFSLQQRASRSG
jgi:hypothetical protein